VEKWIDHLVKVRHRVHSSRVHRDHKEKRDLQHLLEINTLNRVSQLLPRNQTLMNLHLTEEEQEEVLLTSIRFLTIHQLLHPI